MARARKVVSDMSSGEYDELRRQFNNLLAILQQLANEVDATTITADEAFTVLATLLAAGVDVNQDNVDGGSNDHVGTGREINGVRPTPTHPRRARDQGTEELETGY